MIRITKVDRNRRRRWYYAETIKSCIRYWNWSWLYTEWISDQHELSKQTQIFVHSDQIMNHHQSIHVSCLLLLWFIVHCALCIEPEVKTPIAISVIAFRWSLWCASFFLSRTSFSLIFFIFISIVVIDVMIFSRISCGVGGLFTTLVVFVRDI